MKYNLKDSQEIRNALECYKERLPEKPYYTNDFLSGKKIARRELALKFKHIQPNTKTHLYFLIFDVDRQTAVIDWYDLGLPPPHLVVKNPENGHAHLTYILNTSVKNDVFQENKPFKFYTDVRLGLAIRLAADLHYNSILTKNPFHPDWEVFSFQSEPYDLNYLSEFIDRPAVKRHKESFNKSDGDDSGVIGRNSSTFETLRKWAYKNFQTENFDQRLESYATELNRELPTSLSTRELQGVVKSIKTFIKRNFSKEKMAFMKSIRASHSGLKGGRRPKKYEQKPWIVEGIPASTYYYRKKNSINKPKFQPWVELGLSRRTYYRRKAQGQLDCIGTKLCN